MTRRSDLLESIFEAQFDAGQWQALSRAQRRGLRQKWGLALKGVSVGDLEGIIAQKPLAPMVVVDETLTLHLTARNMVRRHVSVRDPLLEQMEAANATGLILQGFDLNGQPVFTNASDLDRHMTAVGDSGMGKSNCMATLMGQMARMTDDNGQPLPIVLIDPHGTLIESAITALPQHRLEDVVIIDPADCHNAGWGINLLQMMRDSDLDDSAPNFAVHMQKNIDAAAQQIALALDYLQQDTTGFGAGASIQTMMREVMMAITERENTSLVDAVEVAGVQDVRKRVADDTSRPHVRGYFHEQFAQFGTEYMERLHNKLQIFRDITVISMFCRRNQCVPLTELIDQRKIIIFDLNVAKIGRQTSRAIGYLLVLLMQFIIDKRDINRDGDLLTLFIDEFSNFASVATAPFLAEARKKGAGIIMGFQFLSQVPEAVSDSLSNVGTWAVFRPHPDDAVDIARKLNLTQKGGSPDPTKLIGLEQFHCWMKFDRDIVTNGKRLSRQERRLIHALPPRLPPSNIGTIIDQIRERSRRLYYKPFDETDTLTVYQADDAGTEQMLAAMFAAHAATTSKAYLPPAGFHHDAKWAIESQQITRALLVDVLKVFGVTINSGRAGELIRALMLRELVTTRQASTGYRTTVLTKKGMQEIRRTLTPQESSNEGGAQHQALVATVALGLQRLSTVPLRVPDQVTTEYTPDLIIEPPEGALPSAWTTSLCAQGPVHVHVEVAGAGRVDKMRSNVDRALREGARPILVFAIDDTDGRGRRTLRAAHDRLQTSMLTASGAIMQGSNPQKAYSPADLTVWGATPSGELVEWDSRLDGVRQIRDIYPLPDANGFLQRVSPPHSGPAHTKPADVANPPAPVTVADHSATIDLSTIIPAGPTATLEPPAGPDIASRDGEAPGDDMGLLHDILLEHEKSAPEPLLAFIDALAQRGLELPEDVVVTALRHTYGFRVTGIGDRRQIQW